MIECSIRVWLVITRRELCAKARHTMKTTKSEMTVLCQLLFATCNLNSSNSISHQSVEREALSVIEEKESKYAEHFRTDNYHDDCHNLDESIHAPSSSSVHFISLPICCPAYESRTIHLAALRWFGKRKRSFDFICWTFWK